VQSSFARAIFRLGKIRTAGNTGYVFPAVLYNDYVMAKSKNFSPRRNAAQQNSIAVLPYTHCNEHPANDLINRSLPNGYVWQRERSISRSFSPSDDHYEVWAEKSLAKPALSLICTP
jgi:hypothetical protein